MTQITLLAKTAPTDCLIVSSIGRDYEKKTVKIIWKTKIKREVTKFSIYIIQISWKFQCPPDQYFILKRSRK